MMRILLILMLIGLALHKEAQATDLVLVANIDKQEMALTKREIRDLFMGSSSDIALTPLSLNPNSPERRIFNTKVIGLTESRIQSYWAQMRFSGRKKPPKEFSSVELLLAKLSSTPDSIGYLPSGTVLPKGLIIVYQSQ